MESGEATMACVPQGAGSTRREGPDGTVVATGRDTQTRQKVAQPRVRQGTRGQGGVEWSGVECGGVEWVVEQN